MAVPLLAWRVAVKWFPDNGTPEREREREREEADAAERAGGDERAKTKKEWEEGRGDNADLHFSD